MEGSRTPLSLIKSVRKCLVLPLTDLIGGLNTFVAGNCVMLQTHLLSMNLIVVRLFKKFSLVWFDRIEGFVVLRDNPPLYSLPLLCVDKSPLNDNCFKDIVSILLIPEVVSMLCRQILWCIVGVDLYCAIFESWYMHLQCIIYRFQLANIYWHAVVLVAPKSMLYYKRTYSPTCVRAVGVNFYLWFLVWCCLQRKAIFWSDCLFPPLKLLEALGWYLTCHFLILDVLI